MQAYNEAQGGQKAKRKGSVKDLLQQFAPGMNVPEG